jgi:hypothetical protein
MTYLIRLFILLTLFSTTTANAFLEGSRYFTSIAYMNENLTRTTNDESGKTSFMGSESSIPIFFGLSLAKSAEGTGVWQPRIGYTFMPREDADGAIKVEYLILSFPYIRPFGTSTVFDYMVGTSYISQTSKGTGGTISSSNGGSPATFYAGDYNQKAQYMSVDLGLGYNTPPFKIEANLFVLSALSDKRSYDLLINFVYFWGN